MTQKKSVDESLTLKEKEWSRLLVTNNLEEVTKIILLAKERRDSKRVTKQQKAEEYLKRRKNLTRIKLHDRAEEFRTDLIKNQTPSETKFKAILKMMRIKYEFQKIYYTKTSFYVADFYLSEHDMIIEIDGGYHNDPKQKIKDAQRSKELKEEVNGVYRLKNEAVLNVDLTRSLVNEFLAKNKQKLLNIRINNTIK